MRQERLETSQHLQGRSGGVSPLSRAARGPGRGAGVVARTGVEGSELRVASLRSKTTGRPNKPNQTRSHPALPQNASRDNFSACSGHSAIGFCQHEHKRAR